MAFFQTRVSSASDVLANISNFAAEHGWARTTWVGSSGSGSIAGLGAYAGGFSNLTSGLGGASIGGSTGVGVTDGKAEGVVLTRNQMQISLTRIVGDIYQAIVISGNVNAIDSPIHGAFYVLNSETNPFNLYLFCDETTGAIVCVGSVDGISWRWLAFGTAVMYGGLGDGQWFGGSHAFNETTVLYHGIFFSGMGGGYSLINWEAGVSFIAEMGTESAGAFRVDASGYAYGLHTPSKSQGCLFMAGENRSWDMYTAYSNSWVPLRIYSGPVASGDTVNPGPTAYVSQPDPLHFPAVRPLLSCPSNLFNGQATLVPFILQQATGVNASAIIGHIPNIRSLRVDNFKGGDIIRNTSSNWMVFPWTRKVMTSADLPAGETYPQNSGLLGWAIKYDGP